MSEVPLLKRKLVETPALSLFIGKKRTMTTICFLFLRNSHIQNTLFLLRPVSYDWKSLVQGYLMHKKTQLEKTHQIRPLHFLTWRKRPWGPLGSSSPNVGGHRNWFFRKAMLSFGSHSGPPVQRIAAKTGSRVSSVGHMSYAKEAQSGLSLLFLDLRK